MINNLLTSQLPVLWSVTKRPALPYGDQYSPLHCTNATRSQSLQSRNKSRPLPKSECINRHTSLEALSDLVRSRVFKGVLPYPVFAIVYDQLANMHAVNTSYKWSDHCLLFRRRKHLVGRSTMAHQKGHSVNTKQCDAVYLTVITCRVLDPRMHIDYTLLQSKWLGWLVAADKWNISVCMWWPCLCSMRQSPVDIHSRDNSSRKVTPPCTPYRVYLRCFPQIPIS